MGLSAFRYVWPDSTSLRLRLGVCFVLVLLERGVNLAVPIFYKNMVDTLSNVTSMMAANRQAAASTASSLGPAAAVGSQKVRSSA